MTSEPNTEDTSVKVEIIPQPSDKASQTTEKVGTSDIAALDDETRALIDAIKKRAQAEAQSAGTLTREAYLNAVRQARQVIEQNQLVLDPNRLENSFAAIQNEAAKNWDSIVKEVSELGDRLTDAAKAAWDALTAPRK
jgi:hypothetical protein